MLFALFGDGDWSMFNIDSQSTGDRERNRSRKDVSIQTKTIYSPNSSKKFTHRALLAGDINKYPHSVYKYSQSVANQLPINPFAD